MRALLGAGGIHTMVTNKEYEFVDKFLSTHPSILNKKLNMQDAETARILTNKGVLLRFKNKAGMGYKLNQNKSVKQKDTK